MFFFNFPCLPQQIVAISHIGEISRYSGLGLCDKTNKTISGPWLKFDKTQPLIFWILLKTEA